MEKNTFENNLNRIEKIVADLESGELSLDDSLKLFEEGSGLISACNSMLNEAEQKVMLVKKSMSGEPVLTAFEEE